MLATLAKELARGNEMLRGTPISGKCRGGYANDYPLQKERRKRLLENELSVFENEDFGQVRVVVRDNEPWFVAADVCKVLQIVNSRDALTRIDDDEKGVVLTDTLGGKQKVTIVNEPGLYTLVLSSRKPEAKAFRRWITHEVIPSIRKHGAYLTPDTMKRVMQDPDFIIGLVEAIKTEQAARKVAETKVELLAAETLTWADRKVLNAIVRRYAARVCGGDFARAWNSFYKELLYKHDISLRGRATSRMNSTGKRVRPFDTLADEEVAQAIGTAVAMCHEDDVDISDLLENKAA